MKLSSVVFASALLASTVLAGSLQDDADFYKRMLGAGSRRRERDIPPPAVKQPVIQKREPMFLNNKTQPFEVNGTGVPDVLFDIGESYAGLLPISDHPDETRKLFFWYFPSPNNESQNEVTIWFNGGPGCSSLHGLLEEFGPFTWQSGTAAPVPNPYTWTNLTNMVFVEQPVGVGFTQGVPNITNEDELAQQFLGFHKSFVDTFDLHGKNMYISGESYGGMYVNYVAGAFVDANDTTYYNLKGVNQNDALIGDRTIQQNAVIVPLADYFDNMFALNDTFKEYMHKAHEECGYADYIEKYLTFPPPQEPFVLPPQLQNKSLPCDLFDDVMYAILETNPCFEVWHLSQQCPQPFSPLGKVFPTDYFPATAQVYFNRSDVQAAINAPVGTDWEQCTSINVFGGPTDNKTAMDTSITPGVAGIITKIIEHTNNIFIGSGDLDYILSTNSTLLAIQNITFNGLRGLQQNPNYPLFTPYHPEPNRGARAGAGVLGSWGSERGLTFYHVRLSGHELPGYAPGASYRVMEVMLGRVDNLSVVSDFTTQMGIGGNDQVTLQY